jgi:hypothetical protein
MTNDTNSFEEWKAELIRITADELKIDPAEVKINEEEARFWYNDGWPAYAVFRENWDSDGD